MMNNKIWITGDIHGWHDDVTRFSSKRWVWGHQNRKELTKDDYMIITGDFGLVWYPPENKYYKADKYWLDWLNDKPYTILFIDGNHENHPMLRSFPEVDMFGSKVKQIHDSIFYLQRGHIYTIHGKTFFTFGGAKSTDKENRITGISWWEEEIPNYKEETLALDNLKQYNYEVDYIITHTAPKTIIGRVLSQYNPNWLKETESYDYVVLNDRYNDPTARFLEHLKQTIKFKKWFFGHFHDDVELTEKFRALYRDIISLN